MLPYSSDRYIATRIDRNRLSERGGGNPPRKKGEKMLSMGQQPSSRTFFTDNGPNSDQSRDSCKPVS
ncbi:hypothetical protein NXC12_PD00399 (plasmid) [Rhizobium etli]|uniref:Uncharacterized protein n=1 Tax=Rhizobium etli TaxID=29449 RepID=A0AAN1BLP2_RHIET|nr:hypothetical protein NXC12_PD00399 [Rhizobium etli]